MSERRSWDVQPKRRAGAAKRAPQALTAPRAARPRAVDGMRQVRRQPAAPVRAPRTARPAGERLRERRRRRRKSGTVALGIFFFVLLAAALYVTWLPAMRIQEVKAEGPRAQEVEQLARENLTGKRALVFPRNSIFFFPRHALRETVLAAYPEISALSISRSSFTSITLSGTPRTKAFIWCGTSIDAGYPDGSCFETDAEGLVFRQAQVSTTTVVLSTGAGTPATAGDLRIFSPLDTELGEGQSPVGSRVVNHEAIPDALRFVKAIRGLGVPVSALMLRGDEADLWLNGPTRITYVLGHEEEAAQLAASVIPTLNLTDGSIQYLDLRFKGKAYVKRHGE